jgi:hypothetical protein
MLQLTLTHPRRPTSVPENKCRLLLSTMIDVESMSQAL